MACWQIQAPGITVDIVDPKDFGSGDKVIQFSSQDEATRFLETFSPDWNNFDRMLEAIRLTGDATNIQFHQEVANQLARLVVSDRLRLRKSDPVTDKAFQGPFGMKLGVWMERNQTCVANQDQSVSEPPKEQEKPRATSTVKIDDPKAVLLKKPNQKKAHRIPVALRIVSDTMLTIADPRDLDMEAELTWTNTGKIKVYKSANDTDAQKSPVKFEAIKLAEKEQIVFVEAAEASDSVGDVEFELALKSKAQWEVAQRDSQKNTITCVDITLDICQSRTKKDSDPEPLSEDDKTKIGRFIHEQDTSDHHGRALLIVRKVLPEKFNGKLVLDGVNAANIELFSNERPKAGEAATTLPHDFDLKTEKNEDKKFWVQGKTVSSALRDISLSLRLKNQTDADGDKVVVTVCKFSKLKADIPSTPPVNVRAANAAARHKYEITGGAADHWDFDDSKNRALVLIENSILPADPINMSVEVSPSGVPVSWDTPRDTRPAPDGDHNDVASLSGNPTITRDSGNQLKATLQADGVGTFHIGAFVDTNGANKFEPTIDIQPYLAINLVLVRVGGIRNDSVAGTNAAPVPAAPTSATGCRVTSGGWTKRTAAAYSKATVKVIGGGNDGRRGVNRVFAGWCQHIGPTGSSASVPPGLDIFARYRFDPPAPPPPPPAAPPAPPAPLFRRQFWIFTQSGPAGTTFGPPPAAAPVIEACPVLDVTNMGADGTGGDTCTGQWGGHGPFTPIVRANKTIGQEWTVDTLDSPSVGLGPVHPHLPGSRMIEFRFGIDFRVDLVFWTNITGVANATGDAADRLYSTVQTNNWSVQFSINFDPTTGNPVGAVTPVSLRMSKDPSPTRRAAPVQGIGLETRFPIALDTISVDATA